MDGIIKFAREFCDHRFVSRIVHEIFLFKGIGGVVVEFRRGDLITELATPATGHKPRYETVAIIAECVTHFFTSRKLTKSKFPRADVLVVDGRG